MNEEKNQNNDVLSLLKQAGLSDKDIEELANEVLEGEQKPKDEIIDIETGETIAEEEDVIEVEKRQAEPKEERKYAGIFDSVEKLEQAYKNLQSEYTKIRQKMKPFEQFIDLLQTNPEFAKFIVEKSQEFFFQKEKKKETKGEDWDLDWDYEEKKPEKTSVDKDEIINLVRNEINQILTAQNLINDFKSRHPEVSDEELVQIINHARNFGGDLEASYLILFRDKYKERLKREIIEEIKGKKSLESKSTSQPTVEGVATSNEKDIWKLAIEVANNPAKLKELDANTRYMLLNILARQIL